MDILMEKLLQTLLNAQAVVLLRRQQGLTIPNRFLKSLLKEAHDLTAEDVKKTSIEFDSKTFYTGLSSILITCYLTNQALSLEDLHSVLMEIYGLMELYSNEN